MAYSGKFGLKRLLAACQYSVAGLRAAWHWEEAFRQELLLSLALLPAAWWLGENPFQRALLVAVWLLVLIVELLNSAVEATVDRIGLEHDPVAARAKDMASAAVLFAILLAVLVWAAIIWQRVMGA